MNSTILKTPAGGPAFPGAGLLSRLGGDLLLPAALVALLLGFGWVEPRILSGDNLGNLAVQASYLVIFATAQVFVLVVRGFDLSLGTLVSLASVSAVMVMTAVAPLAGEGAATLAALAWIGLLGGAWGAFNGLGVAVLRVNPFIATLATANIALGLATTISGGFPVEGVTPQLRLLLDEAHPAGVPVAVLITVALTALGYWLLQHTVLGRAWYLIGGNPRAAHVAGLPVRRYMVLAYMACACYAGIGALMLTARAGSGEPNLGGNLTMEAIAAAVIGGASLRGGSGGVSAAVLGALVITVLSNGMNLVQVDGYLQQITLGAVIIVALFADRLRNRGAR
ncbi:ABC transporter permease [Zoogloea sp.]|uniref:ABC transporter permease n=1 Tax=Zoogloea sp. TaxID=49181 RepID=UPI0014159657|nr:MAG: ABC transporter permease [Zoogloea sp.]